MTADLDKLIKEIKALPQEKKLMLVERLEQDGFFDDYRLWKKTRVGTYKNNRIGSSKTPSGSNGLALLRFAGTIDKNDLVAIQKTIDEGCEAVDQKVEPE